MKINFSLSFADKRNFFDRDAVRNSVEPAFVDYLSAGGAYVRTVAQRSLRRSQYPFKPSKPGTAPRHKTGGSNENLRRIFFVMAANKMSCDIGPVRYEQKKMANGGQTVPAIHEYGGIVGQASYKLSPKGDTKWMFEPENAAKYIGLANAIKKYTKYKNNGKGKKQFGKKQPKTLDDFGLEYQFRQTAYPKRPFMKPAITRPQTVSKLVQIWKQTLGATISKGIKWSRKNG